MTKDNLIEGTRKLFDEVNNIPKLKLIKEQIGGQDMTDPAKG